MVNKWESNYTIFNKKELSLIAKVTKKMKVESDKQGYKSSSGIVYFENKKGDYIDTERCCNNDSCIASAKKEIKKKCEVIHCSNDTDHDKFDRCAYCDNYLNEFLTWIDSELSNQYNLDKLDYNSFEVYGILESLGWCVDFRFSEYEKRNPESFIAKEVWNENLKNRIMKLVNQLK
jgi:hypothetical protein